MNARQRCFVAVVLVSLIIGLGASPARSASAKHAALPILIGESPPRGGMYTKIILRRGTAGPYDALKRLKAGKYRLYIRVRLPDHNFHLIGPGVDKATKPGFLGQLTWVITFRPGVYHYQADKLLPRLRGYFTVY